MNGFEQIVTAYRGANMKKGFSLGDLGAAVLLLVVAAVVTVVGVLILTTINGSTTNTAAQGAVNQGVTGLTTISSNFNLIATVVVFAIIIGLIYRYYMGASMNGGAS